MKQRYSILLGSGSYLPTRIIKNEDFGEHAFYDQQGIRLGYLRTGNPCCD